ncbi:MAG: hypothetical protein AAGE01_22135 [Pseudomonadota bacterium]
MIHPVRQLVLAVVSILLITPVQADVTDCLGDPTDGQYMDHPVMQAFLERLRASDHPEDRLALVFIDMQADAGRELTRTQVASLVSDYPDDPIVLRWTQSLCRFLNDCPDDLTERWVAADPNNLNAWLALADEYVDAGDRDAAAGALIAGRHARNDRAWGELGAVFINAFVAHGGTVDNGWLTGMLVSAMGFEAGTVTGKLFLLPLCAEAPSGDTLASACLDVAITLAEDRATVAGTGEAQLLAREMTDAGHEIPVEVRARLDSAYADARDNEWSYRVDPDADLLGCYIREDPIQWTRLVLDQGEVAAQAAFADSLSRRPPARDPVDRSDFRMIDLGRGHRRAARQEIGAEHAPPDAASQDPRARATGYVQLVGAVGLAVVLLLGLGARLLGSNRSD